MPRRTEGTQRDSLYPKLEALADDEISNFLEKHEAFARKGLYGYLANMTIVTDAWFAALAEIKHISIIMEWWLNNGWLRVFPKNPERKQCFTYALEKAYVKYSNNSLNLYGLWTMWQTPLIRGHIHFSRLISAKKAEALCIAADLTPLHGYMPQFMDMPKPPAYLQQHGGTSTTPAAVIATSDTKKYGHSSSKKVNFGSMRSAHDALDQSPLTSSSASTITVADDYGAYDDSALRQVVSDPANENLIAQLTALVAATTIGQSRMPASPGQQPVERTAASYKDREFNDVKMSSRTSHGDSRDTRSRQLDATMDRACYSFFVHGTCPRENECRYSHEDSIINDARLQCMTRWKAGTKTVFSNLTVLDETFPLGETDNGSGYSQAERNGVYEYVEEIVSSGKSAHM